MEMHLETVHEKLCESHVAFEICWEIGILEHLVFAHYGLLLKRISNCHEQRSHSTSGVCVNDVLGLLKD